MDSSASFCCACDASMLFSERQLLSCGHVYCSTCFTQYLHGSIDELNRYIRCAHCGNQTLLTYERKKENLLFRFGRDTKPKIQHATGLTRLRNGNYVILDVFKHRVYIFDESGKLVTDFAYLYKYDVQYGILADSKNRIIFPVVTKDSKNAFNTRRYNGLAYYNQSGSPVGMAFFDDVDCDIQSLAVTKDNHIIATDAANSKIWFIHEKQRVMATKVLKPETGEKESPQPWGVAVDHQSGCYFITDAANHCVKVFSQSDDLIFKFGSQGEQPGEFNHPAGIAVDEATGRIIVADKHNHRVQIFNDAGVFQNFIVRYNSGSDVYMLPVDVMYIGDGKVAVLLRGERDAEVSEVRMYPCEGHPDVLSC